MLFDLFILISYLHSGILKIMKSHGPAAYYSLFFLLYRLKKAPILSFLSSCLKTYIEFQAINFNRSQINENIVKLFVLE